MLISQSNWPDAHSDPHAEAGDSDDARPGIDPEDDPQEYRSTFRSYLEDPE